MRHVIAQHKKEHAVRGWVLSVLIAMMIIGTFGIAQSIIQQDTVTLAGAIILLLSAALGSVVNVMRTNKVADRIAANQISIALHERALDRHTIVSVTDRDGKITAINRNFTNAFGYEAHEVIGKSPALLYENEASNQTFADVKAQVAGGKVWSGPQSLRSKDGKCVTVQATIFPKLDALGRVIELVSVCTDVSGAMAQSAEVGRNSVAEALSDGVVIYDPETFRLCYANRSFKKRAGWENEDLSGRSINELFTEAEMKMFKRYLDPLVTGESKQVVFDFEHRSGPVEVLTHAVENIHGGQNLVSVVREINERKKAEELKLSSVSTVSHELRTPLTSIKGALRLLDSGVMGELDSDVAKLIGVAHRNSERLLAIVNDILTLEKLHSGDLTIRTESLDLRDLLNDAAEANAAFAMECQVKFVVETFDQPACVRADSSRLMQVMSNLMSNAAKLSPAGTDVILRIDDRDGVWRVSVEDKGPGIPEHARSKLFDSFIQVENTQNKAFASTGLGLTICREIVRRHGGRIAFDTQVGQGSTFYFELEKAADSAEADTKLSAVA